MYIKYFSACMFVSVVLVFLEIRRGVGRLLDAILVLGLNLGPPEE